MTSSVDTSLNDSLTEDTFPLGQPESEESHTDEFFDSSHFKQNDIGENAPAPVQKDDIIEVFHVLQRGSPSGPPFRRVWLVSLPRRMIRILNAQAKLLTDMETSRIFSIERSVKDWRCIRMTVQSDFRRFKVDIQFTGGAAREKFLQFMALLVGPHPYVDAKFLNTINPMVKLQLVNGNTKEEPSASHLFEAKCTNNPYHSIRFWCTTWNAWGKANRKGSSLPPPQEVLKELIPMAPEHDLIAVCVQKAWSQSGSCDQWVKAFQDYFGEDFTCVGMAYYHKTLIYVTVRSKLTRFVGNVQFDTYPVDGNKADSTVVGVGLRLMETHIAVFGVCMKEAKGKSANKYDILDKCLASLNIGNPTFGLTQFQHIVLLGDFNSNNELNYDKSSQLAEAGDYEKIMEYDPFNKHRIGDDSFLFGFREPPVSFPPPCYIGSGDSYLRGVQARSNDLLGKLSDRVNMASVPSYNSRVLHCSFGAQPLQCLRYYTSPIPKGPDGDSCYKPLCAEMVMPVLRPSCRVLGVLSASKKDRDAKMRVFFPMNPNPAHGAKPLCQANEATKMLEKCIDRLYFTVPATSIHQSLHIKGLKVSFCSSLGKYTPTPAALSSLRTVIFGLHGGEPYSASLTGDEGSPRADSRASPRASPIKSPIKTTPSKNKGMSLLGRLRKGESAPLSLRLEDDEIRLPLCYWSGALNYIAEGSLFMGLVPPKASQSLDKLKSTWSAHHDPTVAQAMCMTSASISLRSLADKAGAGGRGGVRFSEVLLWGARVVGLVEGELEIKDTLKTCTMDDRL